MIRQLLRQLSYIAEILRVLFEHFILLSELAFFGYVLK